MATEVWGPEDMFSVQNEAETETGPFYRQIQDTANRGAPYTIRRVTETLWTQQIPDDLAYRSTNGSVQKWLDHDPTADISGMIAYIQCDESEYNNDDVPSYMPNSTIYDEEGNPVRQRKWFEWRSPLHTHWKSQSQNVYAVPSTSFGTHVNWRVMYPLDPSQGGNYPLRTQKDWDNMAAGLPPDDIIAWPES